MATLGVGPFPNFHYFPTSLPIQLGFFYETLNLSSSGPKLSTPGSLPQLATLGVGAFPDFHDLPIPLQIQLGSL